MNTIQKKIILLSLIIWLFMAGTWLFMSFINQNTVRKYNEILQRYMLMKEASQLSQNAVTALNLYMVSATKSNLDQYEKISGSMKRIETELSILQNQNNSFSLVNYQNMIDSQIEAMELAVTSKQNGRNELAANLFDEGNKISKYISDATLSLLSRELTTYDDFYRKIIVQSNNLKNMGLWMLATASFGLLLFSYRFSTGITRSIRSLTLAAREIARGNFDHPITIRTNDEISFLARTFEKMRINIKELISEMQNKAQIERDLQEHKLLLKESELKSLQSQINPHFLFNTLNTLAKKAYIEGATGTSDLISSVSGLLRYNLRKLDVSVTLKDEINGIEEYLIIQKARFNERVLYALSVEESCLSAELPSLTLQPFVENAFIHAVEPTLEGGVIAIRVNRQNGHAVVEIEDNGPGMEQEQIQAILEGTYQDTEFKGHSTGIGISNVIRRLRLFFGTDNVIEISSGPECGTCIKLLIPLIREDKR